MKHPGTRALFDYWTALRSGRSAPYKAEISARGVGRALAGQTFVLERIGEGDIRFRLAGGSLYDVFGLELRGMSALSVMLRKDRERFAALIDAALRRPCLALTQLGVSNRAGEEIEMEMLLTPLRSDFDDMNRVLGSIHPLNYREVPSATRRCRIISAHTLSFETAGIADDHPPLAGFGEGGAEFSLAGAPDLKTIEGGATATERRRGHLRIVKS